MRLITWLIMPQKQINCCYDHRENQQKQQSQSLRCLLFCCASSLRHSADSFPGIPLFPALLFSLPSFSPATRKHLFRSQLPRIILLTSAFSFVLLACDSAFVFSTDWELSTDFWTFRFGGFGSGASFASCSCGEGIIPDGERWSVA